MAAWTTLRSTFWRAFAVIGMVATILIIVGLVLDARAFDRTRGGYEPPYTEYTGTPMDWGAVDTTSVGMAHRGYVVNLLIDCTTGMIEIEWFKLQLPFRKLSPRALAVHKPRDACVERGFDPAF